MKINIAGEGMVPARAQMRRGQPGPSNRQPTQISPLL